MEGFKESRLDLDVKPQTRKTRLKPSYVYSIHITHQDGFSALYVTGSLRQSSDSASTYEHMPGFAVVGHDEEDIIIT